jgi:hypothetical protein
MKELRETNKTEWLRRNAASRRRYKEKYRVRKLARIYGVTETRIIQLEKQLRCAICGRRTTLNIDHCHRTKKVRARLCPNCNRGLGLFKENVAILRSAIGYLEHYA